jgi:hypothetical protein
MNKLMFAVFVAAAFAAATDAAPRLTARGSEY